MTATSRRPGLSGLCLAASIVWLLGVGAFAFHDAWNTAGRIYVIDDTGARAISLASYEQRKIERDLVGMVPQTTPEGVMYVVSNVSLPKFKTDTKRHHRMVRFNHEEQGWFRLLGWLPWAAAPLVLVMAALGLSRLWRRIKPA